MHHIKLFVASSNEISDFRIDLVKRVTGKNKLLESRQVHIDIDMWEFESAAVPLTGRSQDAYNELLSQADIVIVLLKNKIGKYTHEEFLKAIELFRMNNKPRVVLYTIPSDCIEESLTEFLEFLRNEEMGFDYFPSNVPDNNALWISVDQELERIISENTSLLNFQEIMVSIETPKLPFFVEYYLLHVKDGKDEWLPQDANMPLNKEYLMLADPLTPNIYTAKISTYKNIGFQFKCYARCEQENIKEFIRLLKKHYRYFTNRRRFINKHTNSRISFKLISQSDHNKIWFIVPSYSLYITSDKKDPFLNNYYYHS